MKFTTHEGSIRESRPIRSKVYFNMLIKGANGKTATVRTGWIIKKFKYT
jgi:hypothetical protein